MDCLYLLTNQLNDKQYVGECGNFNKRMREHKTSKKNTLINNAIQKDGWENFTREILDEGIPEKDREDILLEAPDIY